MKEYKDITTIIISLIIGAIWGFGFKYLIDAKEIFKLIEENKNITIQYNDLEHSYKLLSAELIAVEEYCRYK